VLTTVTTHRMRATQHHGATGVAAQADAHPPAHAHLHPSRTLLAACRQLRHSCLANVQRQWT
jgi:hypothetical protein